MIYQITNQHYYVKNERFNKTKVFVYGENNVK